MFTKQKVSSVIEYVRAEQRWFSWFVGDFSIFCVTVRWIGSKAYYSGIKNVLKLTFVKTLSLVVMFTKLRSWVYLGM